MSTTATQHQESAASEAPAACEVCGQPLAGAGVVARYRRQMAKRDAALRADLRRELSAEYASRERDQAAERQQAAETAVERRWERRFELVRA